MSEVTFPCAVGAGVPHPAGAVPDANGVNFAVFSEYPVGLQLLLFKQPNDLQPSQVVSLSPVTNRTFRIWHAYVHGLKPGTAYAWRAAGPGVSNARSLGFDPTKVLIDPYARAVTHDLWDRGAACQPGDNVALSMRSVVVDAGDYEWEGDQPLKRPMSETIIYEAHVRGFMRSPSAGTSAPGTFAGLMQKIPYLRQLGVTAVELMPVCQFDEREFSGVSPVTGQRLSNFWGYSTLGFFAPHSGYCVSPSTGSHLREFRDMVKALHRAGLEVILDMVLTTRERVTTVARR